MIAELGPAILAVTEGAAAEEGGSFLVSPNVGLMIWSLVVFGFSFLLLR